MLVSESILFPLSMMEEEPEAEFNMLIERGIAVPVGKRMRSTCNNLRVFLSDR